MSESVQKFREMETIANKKRHSEPSVMSEATTVVILIHVKLDHTCLNNEGFFLNGTVNCHNCYSNPPIMGYIRDIPKN